MDVKPDKITKTGLKIKVSVTAEVLNKGPDPATPKCAFSLKVNGRTVSNKPEQFARPLGKNRKGNITAEFEVNLTKGDQLEGAVTVSIVEPDVKDPVDTNNSFPRSGI